MGMWIAAVEAKARIIHEQLAAAQLLAKQHRGDPSEVATPYLALLTQLYEDEFAFAHLADSSDLVARFSGPALTQRDPTVGIVASVFSDLQREIRGIAKSIVGLTSEKRLRWPAELDPHLAGLAHGSLIVGVRVPSPNEVRVAGQTSIPGASDHIYASVRSAVRSLATVARYVGQHEIDDSIRNEFPDPAFRDTVMVAASRLAPTGRRGIDRVSLIGPEPHDVDPGVLTVQSRRILSQALDKPLRTSGSGTFEGVVREIDLDARRFEIRRVRGAGAIRCIYDLEHAGLVRSILDAQIRVSGNYESLANEQPRLIEVTEITVVQPPQEQLSLE